MGEGKRKRGLREEEKKGEQMGVGDKKRGKKGGSPAILGRGQKIAGEGGRGSTRKKVNNNN